MKEKNKGKVFKQIPLTFEEKMEKMMQEQKTQIENLTKLVQIQFDMIKSLQENKIEQLSKNGSSSKAENESKKNVELNESLNKSKSKNFMIDNIIKITSESMFLLIH